MNPKQSKNSRKFPKTEFAFYVKLYCNQKDSTKFMHSKNLIEATKSWLALNESEKRKFNDKFKEWEDKYKIQIFDQLKNARPYMKLKEVENSNGNATMTNNAEIESSEKASLDHISEDETVETNSEIGFENHINPSTSPLLDDLHEENVIPENTGYKDNESLPPLLVEPIPPTVKTGHELYYMLNSTDESNRSAWASLPQHEKNQYSRAVTLVKKDYIIKYKEYLASLSPKVLFDYYYKNSCYQCVLL